MKKISKQVPKMLSREIGPKKARSYKPDKTLPKPPKMAQNGEMKHKVTAEGTRCCINQNYSFHYFPYSRVLSRRNIVSKEGKEKLIAKRNLKQLSHEMQKWIYKELQHKISKEEELEALHNFVDHQEERHFQIDRIIRYLANP